MPKRIQRKRVKGWRIPEGAIYVGRPSKWGNPFKVGSYCRDLFGPAKLCTPELAKQWYRAWLTAAEFTESRALLNSLHELRGRDLVCWCPILHNGEYIPCHADVLISLANDVPMEEVIRENIRQLANSMSDKRDGE